MKMINSSLQTLPDTQIKERRLSLDELLQIEPTFDVPKALERSFSPCLDSLGGSVKRAFPEEILFLEESHDDFYQKLHQAIPCISWVDDIDTFPSVLSILTICQAEYTHGIGRFLGDVYSRWLIPGKHLPLVFVHSMAFRFKQDLVHSYFLHEIFVKIENKKDLLLAQSHLPNLVTEVKLNILSVQHARKIMLTKPLNLDEKRLMIQENISSLLDRPSKDLNLNIFDQMHHFLIKVSSEEKMTQIKEQISPLLESRPQLFERDIFNELQNFVFLFRDIFAANRNLRHLTRIIAYAYLFRKGITNASLTRPNERHLSIKFIHTDLKIDDQETGVLGVLVAINLLRENEIIGEKHIYKAIQSILPSAKKVPDSTITDRRTNSHAPIIYLEVFKQDSSFTKEEIAKLRQSLPREIKTRIESVINPIFMPRNEEEVMRNILILSHQLKYAQDIPQVIISFHKQTEENLSFTIILLRLLRPKDAPLQTLFTPHKSEVSFTEHEIKIIGRLRKRYPKEANIFEMHLQKKRFLRKDFSVDLNAARRFIYTTLSEMLGEVRDYNGGMISKQAEVLNELKKLLLQINIHNDFLLENFFYSLTPTYMQSILRPHILKKLFLLVLEALETDYSKHMYFLKTQIVENHFLITIAAINPSLKEFLEPKIDQLEFEPSSLTSSYVNIYDISTLSYCLKFTDSDEHQKFLQLIIESIKIWKDTMQKNISSPFFPR